MGKISAGAGSEPVFSPLKTTDDDDEEEQSAGVDGGPATTRYRDDPQAVAADDGGPPVRFSDDPGKDSIFDWGDGGGGASGGGGGGDKEKKKKKKKKKSKKKANKNDNDGDDDEEGGDLYHIDEFDADAAGFSPVSLHDDSSDEENGGGDDEEGSEKERIRIKANKILNKRIFDDTTYDSGDERIFVGGGWGRHGSQFSLSGLCGCCADRDPTYSLGPKQKDSGSCRMACFGIAFLALMFGAGYVGYQAGLPVEDELDGEGGNETGANAIHSTHVKGEDWLKWLEKEKSQMHVPHWIHYKKNKDNPAFKKPIFEAMTQSQLLHRSENIFQSCSERSLRTSKGRMACLSWCHGHYCCFEKDVEYGSCVAEENSYCFAYAACENVITDFEMNNVAGADEGGHVHEMNALDVQLLSQTCSEENVATVVGKLDCTAFCKHHLCCFDTAEFGSCARDEGKQCQAYDACRILVEDLESTDDGVNPDAPSDSDVAAVTVSHEFKTDCLQNNLYENWDICKGHCSIYECCFVEGDSCCEEVNLGCDAHYLCAEVYADEFYTGGEASPAGARVEQATLAVCVAVDDATTCEALCEGRHCRFDFDEEEDACGTHQGCAVPTADVVAGGPGSFGQAVGVYSAEEEEGYLTACAAQAQRDPWLAEQCEKRIRENAFWRCRVASFSWVCWGTEDSAVAVKGDGSQQQQQSSGGVVPIPAAPAPESHGVYDHSPPNEDVNADIKQAVRAVCITLGDTAACAALCEEHLCCFDHDFANTGEGCPSASADLCGAYEGCTVLIEEWPSDDEEMSEVRAVEKSCVENARRDPWLAEQCRKACDSRKCCFEKGSRDCTIETEEWCDEFAACEVIYT